MVLINELQRSHPVDAIRWPTRGRKVRVLCLHGKGTNAGVFASQTSSIRHSLRDICEFVFIDGLHLCDSYPGTDQFYNGPFYSWYHNNSIESLLQAEAAVREKLVQLAPFDGIMGFSQGGALAAFLCARDRLLPPEQQSGLSFAVLLCCGLPAGLSNMDLHVIMPAEMVRLLRQSSEQEKRRASVRSLDSRWFLDESTSASSPESDLDTSPRWRSSEKGGFKGALLEIPTAHIMGQHDSLLARSNELFKLCQPWSRHKYVHSAGHSLPRMSAATVAIAQTIRATVQDAQSYRLDPFVQTSYNDHSLRMDCMP